MRRDVQFVLEELVQKPSAELQAVGLLESLREKWFEDGSWLIRIY